MKAVLLSIKPKYCELIASGKKTIEIRKNRPKLETPFKCYIYCTKEKNYTDVLWTGKNQIMGKTTDKSNSKIIGDFVCDEIENYRICVGIPVHLITEGCISAKQILKYSNNGSDDIYVWHISNLKIYDKPKELSEFHIQRPPQSWHYVEERETNA